MSNDNCRLSASCRNGTPHGVEKVGGEDLFRVHGDGSGLDLGKIEECR
jgi:hypothetical protein